MTPEPEDASRAPVLFVRGDSAYSVLSHFARDWGAALEASGQPVRHLDVHAPGGATELEGQLHSGELRAVIGFSGAGVPADGGRDAMLYENARVPYLGLMLDHPVWVPGRHRIASPWVTYLFSEPDHRRDSVAMSPPGAPRLGFRFGARVPDADPRPLAERSLPALFAKHGGDPEAIRLVWAGADRRHREACEEIAASLLTTADLTAWDATSDYLLATGSTLDPMSAAHLAIVQLVDVYVRRVRATRMLTALLPHPAVIVGGDWGHVDATVTRATFIPGVELPALHALIDATRVVVNVQPLNRHAPQERIIHGMQRGATVLTDGAPRLLDTLGAERILSYTWDADLEPQITAALHDGAADQARADAAVRFARREFDLAICAAELVRTIDAVVDRCHTSTLTQVGVGGADTHEAGPLAPRLTPIGS